MDWAPLVRPRLGFQPLGAPLALARRVFRRASLARVLPRRVFLWERVPGRQGSLARRGTGERRGLGRRSSGLGWGLLMRGRQA